MCVWGGGNGGNCGTGVRASVSKPTPFIYLAFEKTDPFIYLIIRNVDLFIYCPLIFCTHLLLIVRQISQSIHLIPREQAASKNLWAKILCIYFVEKRGPIIYLAALKKGAIRHAHPHYAIYSNLVAPPPPPPAPLKKKNKKKKTKKKKNTRTHSHKTSDKPRKIPYTRSVRSDWRRTTTATDEILGQSDNRKVCFHSVKTETMIFRNKLN